MFKPIDPDNITEDAFERIQDMLTKHDSKKNKKEIASMNLKGEENIELRNKLRDKLVAHSNLPEFHADLLADHMMGLVNDTLFKKEQRAKEEQVYKEEAHEEGNISPIFRRVDE